MTKLEEEMLRVKTQVDSIVLGELLPSSSPIPEVNMLYTMMREYPRRPAKGLRPFICATSCRAFGGKVEDALLTAAAIELFQNWILIHDDLEDGSEMRRGLPSLHRMYDWTLTVNAGDALHVRMWKTLMANKSRLGAEKAIQVMEEFSKLVDETTEGQHIELGWVVGRRWDLTESDYFTMCLKKTAWYTVISPLRLGAIIAGAGQEDLDELVEIGSKLGVGFQIHDDVLNLSGDQSKYGKEIADDLLEGKRTLILIGMLARCTSYERERVIAIFNKKREEKTTDEVLEVLSLIRKYGAVERAAERASRLVEDARERMKRMDWGGDKEAVALLDEVAKFSVERKW